MLGYFDSFLFIILLGPTSREDLFGLNAGCQTVAPGTCFPSRPGSRVFRMVGLRRGGSYSDRLTWHGPLRSTALAISTPRRATDRQAGVEFSSGWVS